jgi:hypothetical protein
VFTVAASVVLPHPPRAVARAVGRVDALPRWCAGLRRAPAAGADPGSVVSASDAGAPDACALTLVAAGVRFDVSARTVRRAGAGAPDAPGADPAPDPALASAAGHAVAHAVAHAVEHVVEHVVEHAARGDGLTLTWTLAAEPAPRVGRPGRAPDTRLHARITVAFDPGHPRAGLRAALCRDVARRTAGDLDRLGALLDRRRARRAAARRARGPGARAAAAGR